MKIDPEMNIQEGTPRVRQAGSGVPSLSSEGSSPFGADSVMSEKKEPPAYKVTPLICQASSFLHRDKIASIAHHVTDMVGRSMSGGTLQVPGYEDFLRKMETMESKGYSFYKKKSSPLPLFADKRQQITSAEALTLLDSTSKDKRQSVEVKDSNTAFLPLDNRDDITALEALDINRDSGAVKNEHFADLLISLAGRNCRFYLEGKNGKEQIGAFGAYKLLTDPEKGNDHPEKKVFVENDMGVLMMLNRDRAQERYTLSEELRESDRALEDLKRRQPALTADDLKVIGAYVEGSTLKDRVELFEHLCDMKGDVEQAKSHYLLVTECSRNSSDFRHNASIAKDLHSTLYYGKNLERFPEYFRYISNHFKDEPDHASTLCSLLQWGDLSTAHSVLNELKKSVDYESFGRRSSVFSSIIGYEQDLSRAINDYKMLKKNMKRGETLEEASREFLDFLRGKSLKDKKIPDAWKEFGLLKKELTGLQPEKSSLFWRLFTQTGDKEGAKGALEFLERPEGSKDPKVREDIFMRLLYREDDITKAQEDYTFICEHAKGSYDIRWEAGIFNSLFDIFNFISCGGMKSRGENVKEAWLALYEHNTFNSDHFREFVKKIEEKKHFVEAGPTARAYVELREPVKNESYDDRLQAYFDILEVTDKQREVPGEYQGVIEGRYYDEELKDAVAQYVTIAKGKNFADSETPAESYKSIKRRFRSNRSGLNDFLLLVSSLKSCDEGNKAFELLEKQVRSESYEDRKAVFDEIIKNSAGEWEEKKKAAVKPGKTLDIHHDAPLDYDAISGHLPPSESLREGLDRLNMLLQAITTGDRHEKARDAFEVISSELKEGNFPGKSSQEVTSLLISYLLVTDSVEDARAQMHHLQSTKEILTDEEENIFIDGMRVPVNREHGDS